MQKKHNNYIWLETILVVAGVMLLGYNFFNSKKLVAYEYIDSKFLTSSLEEPAATGSPEGQVDLSQGEANDSVTNQVPNYYIGYLEIPKIDFKRGFVDVSSSDNTVEKNIMVIPSSSMPNVDRGNLIIAGHSGIGYKAFFNNLEQLSLKDRAYVTYNNVKYTYEIADIYRQPKTGKVAIHRDYQRNTLTLITCTNNVDGSQTVYIAYLVDRQTI